MTREEAVINLNAIKFILDNDQYTDEIEEALDMAIEALEQPEQPSFPQAHENDCVSRAEAIDAIAELKKKHFDHPVIMRNVMNAIQDLPSAQPEHTSDNDCNGCKFVKCYDTDFPCANCIRKNKDYYTPERRTDE